MNEAFYKHLSLIKGDEHQAAAYKSMHNTVVIAGPGSGKTRVLTLKAMQLMQSHIPDNSGLACLSYSRETVRELKKRLKQYGYRQRPQDYIGTVHCFCLAEIIGPFYHLYPQYEVPKPLKIAPYKEVSAIYQGILKDFEKSEYDLSKTGIDKERLLAIIGQSEVDTELDPAYTDAANEFEKRLKALGYIDFVQIAKTATLMIQEQDYIRQTLEARFPFLLIDEYQDLGKALHEMVLALHGFTDIIIYAVGDMDQSIYGFQGAYPDFLKELYDRDDFDSHELKNNYRSNQDIITASLATLDPKPPLPDYMARTREGEQAQFTFIVFEAEIEPQFRCVANKVIPKLHDEGIPYNEIAVIVGSNAYAGSMAEILMDEGIPAYVASWGFDTRSDVVQWLMECARWCHDPSMHSFDDLFRYWDYLLQIHDDPRKFNNQHQRIITFHKVIEASREREQLLPWLNWIIGELDLGEVMRNSERYPDERENLENLIEEAKSGKLINLPYLRLTRLSEPENEVTVITRHSVKGLEFEAVIMLGMEDGKFPFYKNTPGTKEYEEDKRIAYVCVSRAKKVCVLLRSKKYTYYGQYGSFTRNHQPSVFWKQLHDRFGNADNTFNEYDY